MSRSPRAEKKTSTFSLASSGECPIVWTVLRLYIFISGNYKPGGDLRVGLRYGRL